MTHEHLSALLTSAEAKKDENGWSKGAEGRLLTFYVAFSGAGLTVSRVEAVRAEGTLIKARTVKGEIYVLALSDIYAGAVEGLPSDGRKAGFVAG
jgi:hypothetical protein